MSESLESPIAEVPAGAWAVGVSGGADSVALLSLLRDRSDLTLVVAHLDHETRAGASAEDARFVQQLCTDWRIECKIARRSEIEPALAELPRNVPARFRAVRMAFFRQVAQSKNLQGVILAHHADDQAETVFQRLLRGSGAMGLTGMSPRATIGGVVVLRPLLHMPRQALRDHLVREQIAWREDASNDADMYQRNRVRKLLDAHENLKPPMLELADACRALKQWVTSHSPRLSQQFSVDDVRHLPDFVAREALRHWLAQRMKHLAELEPAAIGRLLTMVQDAATAPRMQFPGGVMVRRRAGMISIDT